VRLYLPEHGGETHIAPQRAAIPQNRFLSGKVILVVETITVSGAFPLVILKSLGLW
jgi:hypothetical protein